ncbi:MAG TPA: hypothetical protein VMZ28_07915 [Kofleriaceae bacterium]|nr:hypothetical protein [Kofleriaceae bacterium]
MRRALVLLLLVALAGRARADDPPDRAATDAVLRRLSNELPKFGIGDLHIVGGGALALARAAREGQPLAWNDIDVRGVASGPLDRALVERIARRLTLHGWSEVLEPGPMDFLVREPRKTALREQGFGLRMQHASGLRFDVAILRAPSDLALSGYNNAESLMVPLRRGDTVDTILRRLGTGSDDEVVAAGALAEPHGNAKKVLKRQLVLSNRYKARAEPELAALRFLRAKEKLSRGGGQVHAGASGRWLQANVRRLISEAPEVADPSYPFQVQEQAQALLRSRNPELLREAKRMGLDVRALARGRISREGAKNAKSRRSPRAKRAR